MKHIFRTLLGLVLLVFVLAGCSNPAGPEVSEIDKTTVVETPEDNIKSVKVEFSWGSNFVNGQYLNPGIGDFGNQRFNQYAPMYLLDLHWDSELKTYIYSVPGEYTVSSYLELMDQEEDFKKFSDDAFEQVFGTKTYKEGEVIDLTQWTSKALLSINNNVTKKYEDCLCFSLEPIAENDDVKNPFDEIVVGNEDIKVYVFFKSNNSSKSK